jgi:hypothetical protein
MHHVSNDFEGLSIVGSAAVSYIATSAIPAADQWSKAVALRPG